jgi:hypothetical protein
MTILEQERAKAREASKAAIEAGEFLKFFRRHPAVMDNIANESMLRAAIGETDAPITLEELEIVFQNDDLKAQLSHHSDKELAKFTAEEAREAAQKLRGMTKEELYADGKRKQQEQLDAATRKAIPPADLTRRSFADATRSERAKWAERYGFAALNAHFDRQEGR